MHPTLQYLCSLQHGSSSYDFSRMRKLVEVLNHPYQKFPSIHVAGTNGKGIEEEPNVSILIESKTLAQACRNFFDDLWERTE